jgi:flagella basal body P-ring formation protein FlgA
MKTLLAVLLLASPAAADPIADVIRAELLPSLPDGTDVASVHLPSALAKLDVEPAAIKIELPRALSIGRPSIKLSVNGKRAVFVPVTIGKVVEVAVAQRSLAVGETITAADINVELRAVDHTALPFGSAASPGQARLVGGNAAAKGGSLVGATVKTAIEPGSIVRSGEVTLAPPVSRGTQVSVEIIRGSVTVRGTGALELAARPGDSTMVRLSHTKAIVRGTLVSQTKVVVGEAP